MRTVLRSSLKPRLRVIPAATVVCTRPFPAQLPPIAAYRSRGSCFPTSPDYMGACYRVRSCVLCGSDGGGGQG
ncbi:hypothetical protein GCM10008937_15040 [Deinococcus depolymerans]|uniref:Secreted protein n=1 Tax=Deinococcus depolymerans TaxID=392408 RepID=A0ABP3LWW2_9DEIO